MNQKDIFLASEGDAWFARNCDRLGERDIVSGVIETAGIVPKRVLEIGCSNGWRLSRLRRKYGCKVVGVEPSIEACTAAAANGLDVLNRTASHLPGGSGFDLVIYGFCLYLTDPADWFGIVSEGDRVLNNGGYLLVHDFDMTGAAPFARKYEHRTGILSYHVDFAKFWLAHPHYHLLEVIVAGAERVTLIRKQYNITVHA
jgi:SAM-dependent methyltransferase